MTARMRYPVTSVRGRCSGVRRWIVGGRRRSGNRPQNWGRMYDRQGTKRIAIVRKILLYISVVLLRVTVKT